MIVLFTLFSYNPRHYYENNPELKQCIDEIASGFFSPEDPGLFRDIANSLLNNDRSASLPVASVCICCLDVFLGEALSKNFFRQR